MKENIFLRTGIIKNKSLTFSSATLDLPIRVEEYGKLYEAFVKGIGRVSKSIPVGGPALASKEDFLAGFLDLVKAKELKLDFISFHIYGTTPWALKNPEYSFNVKQILEQHESRMKVICEHGFPDAKIIIDEWGMSSYGYYNKEESPRLMARDTEVMSAYYVKLIDAYIRSGYNLDKLMICLSGQHEMTEDFSGFRNFFTLNFIKKPIYNAHVLASKLFDTLLKAECENENIAIIPTKNDHGEYAVLCSYASEDFEENIPVIKESISFEVDIKDKVVRVWKIDKETTNPYRLYQKMDVEALSEEQIRLLREEGKLKPILIQDGKTVLNLDFSANSTYLITVTSGHLAF